MTILDNYKYNNPSFAATKANQLNKPQKSLLGNMAFSSQPLKAEFLLANFPAHISQGNANQNNINENSALKTLNSFKNLPPASLSVQYSSIAALNMKVSGAFPVNEKKSDENFVWKNDLKQLFKQNKSIIYAMVMRTFNAKDIDGDGLIDTDKGEKKGTFINGIDRLDELKSMGINTLHILPILPPAKTHAKGTAGCAYAPDTYTEIDPALHDPNHPGTVYDQAREFIKEAHKRNIRVMIDLPSCASVGFAEKNPHLIETDEKGVPKVPQGWDDIVAFKVWEDKESKILNRPLMNMHKKFVDMIVDIGADGIRADVARYKPPEFWTELIAYSRTKDPQFGWLAETYTYEDASPMANIPADRPEPLLKAGFDTIYGQYHIFPGWNKAGDLHDYVGKMTRMSHRLPPNKSLIGSFATHDDKAPFSNGGVPYCNLTTALQATLPMLNPYFVSGFESGDRYIYPYRNQPVAKTETDTNIAFAHPEWIDIFNYSRKPGGDNPEIGYYKGRMFNEKNGIRTKYEDVITRGSYIPLETTNSEDRIIAYTRHYNGKTLLAVMNRNVNGYESGVVKIPTLKHTQVLKDLSPGYSTPSRIKVLKNGLDVNLGPARAHLFEIDTPDIEKHSKTVYKPNQNLPPIDKSAKAPNFDDNHPDMFKMYYMLRQKQTI
ncbi:MAG TPA: hypothetical protein P5556_00410 [Candidatus Gastranaerophilales bacterium]|nr:hypothetical protein [Candidatus Gastranaerophilales bacterium]